MKHTMKLNAQPFSMIESGAKTVELRLYDEKRKSISVGDHIKFVHADDPSRSLLCAVIKLHVFDSFDQLYKSLPLLKCGYTEADVKNASPADMEKYYPITKQALYGVVGIEIKLLNIIM